MINLRNMGLGLMACAAVIAVPVEMASAQAKKAAARPATKAAPNAAPRATTIKLASPADLVAAIKSCSTAVSADGLVPTNLTKAGWKIAPARTRSGRTVTLPMRVYSHAGSQATVMLPQSNAKTGGCIVMAKLASAQDIALAGNVLSSEIGVRPTQLPNGTPMWKAGERAIQIQTEGTREQPAVRAVVIYSSPAPTG